MPKLPEAFEIASVESEVPPKLAVLVTFPDPAVRTSTRKVVNAEVFNFCPFALKVV